MATTESSAVIRLINSVQAQPIFDSFHEPAPISDPAAAPPMPELSDGTGTVIVGQERRRRWPLIAFGVFALLGLAGGVGYVIGTTGSGPQAPKGAAGAAPALAQTDSSTEAEPAVAVTAPVETTEAEPAVAVTAPVETTEAEPAVAETPVAETPAVAGAPIVTDVAPEQTFDASFDIIVEPAGARVVLDGKELGPAPLRIGRLAAGAHVLDIAAPEGYESQRVELDLVSGEREVVRVSLDRIAADEPVAEQQQVEAKPEPKRSETRKRKRAERRAKRRAKQREARVATRPAATKTATGGKGTLMIGSKPPCQIYIDGKNTGLLTPQRSIELSAGKHKVTLVNRDHGLKASTTVTIEPGKTKRLIKDMSSRL